MTSPSTSSTSNLSNNTNKAANSPSSTPYREQALALGSKRDLLQANIKSFYARLQLLLPPQSHTSTSIDQFHYLKTCKLTDSEGYPLVDNFETVKEVQKLRTEIVQTEQELEQIDKDLEHILPLALPPTQ